VQKQRSIDAEAEKHGCRSREGEKAHVGLSGGSIGPDDTAPDGIEAGTAACEVRQSAQLQTITMINYLSCHLIYLDRIPGLAPPHFWV
jgi:hypothetical protein